MNIVLDGKPSATIVIAKEPTRSAQMAVAELQHHIELITGTTLPVTPDDIKVHGTRILVGESKYTTSLGLESTNLEPQEYMLQFFPDTIVLMGKDKDDRGKVNYDFTKDLTAWETWPGLWDEQGTMHAVYDFLEQFCDVRWFNPTDYGTEYTERKNLVVKPKNICRTPTFRYRYASYVSAEDYDLFTSLWLSEGAGIYTGLWQSGSDGFKKYELSAYSELHKKFPDSNKHFLARRSKILLFFSRMRHGGEKWAANHSVYGFYDRFWERNPNNPDVSVEKRADWFAQGYEGRPPQLCYTNPEVIRQVAQDARDYFDDKGIDPTTGRPIKDRNDVWGENNFAVEPMDNTSFCKCVRCQELIGEGKDISPFFSRGNHSDYWFSFVNEVAREVRKTHPDKWISALAYMTHAYPPKRLRLEPNVIIHFCFTNNRMPYAIEEYEHEIKLLNQWRREYPEMPIYLWLYYTFPVEIANNGKFYCFPGFFANTIGGQFELFHNLGIKGMFHCGYGQEVEAYVTFKLMDDPTLNVDEILDEYFRRYYGSASEPMKKLYLAIEEAYCNPANYPPGRPGHQTEEIAWGWLGTEERMAEFSKLMQRARELAKTDIEKKRVKLFELSTWNYMVKGRKQFTSRMTAPIPSIKIP